MKLITVLLFSTLIWPSPFLPGYGKKINQLPKKYVSDKIWHCKNAHVNCLQLINQK